VRIAAMRANRLDTIGALTSGIAAVSIVRHLAARTHRENQSMHWSFTPEFPLGLRRGDLKMSLVGWGGYIALLTSYCSLYNAVVAGLPADVPGTFFYALREWAIWWLLTPLALAALRHKEVKRVPGRVSCLQVAVIVLLASVAFRVAIDLLTEARGIAAVLLIYVPRYLAVSIVLVLFWHFFLRRNRVPRAPGTRFAVEGDRTLSPVADALEVGPAPATAAEPAGPEYPESLLVNFGGHSWPLPLESIEFISAAGKNVDIRSGNRDYAMRATMRELEGTLPPLQFVRVHRSYIVNIEEIDRISASRSGHDVVMLRGGRRINVGKKYRSRLLASVTKTL
jgi:hypothetical protein